MKHPRVESVNGNVTVVDFRPREVLDTLAGMERVKREYAWKRRR